MTRPDLPERGPNDTSFEAAQGTTRLTSNEVRRRQTLERKAAFIHQVAGRDFDEREAEDIGEQVLSFAEVKALATGDARIMEKATVDTDVARLVRLKRLWHEDHRRLRYVLDKARQQAETATAGAVRFAAVFERVTDTRGDKFEMVIDGRRKTKRSTAGESLREAFTTRLQATPLETITEPQPVAYLAGLDILGQTTTAIENEVRLLVPEAEIEMRFVQHEWASLDATQLVQRLERRIQRLPETIERFPDDVLKGNRIGRHRHHARPHAPDPTSDPRPQSCIAERSAPRPGQRPGHL
ncbi:MAG TPA: hypothetical protein VFI47_14810, partial [Acidimicrobiales bacterium]|nr:hypothetical protein [Acidimicrobiales bacterium]